MCHTSMQRARFKRDDLSASSRLYCLERRAVVHKDMPWRQSCPTMLVNGRAKLG